MFKKIKLNKNLISALIILNIAFMIAGLWYVFGYDLKNKFAKAAVTLASVNVTPATNNVDNLVGQTDATWRFTIGNNTLLSSLTDAVEITFPEIPTGSWNLSNITASSTTADPTLQFATTSVAVLNERVAVIMVVNDQTSTSSNFIIDIKGVNNPMPDISSLGSYSWSVKTCTLNISGDPSSGCANDLDSAVTASASLTRRGGLIDDWSFTPNSYSANTSGVEYTITFTASTTLNIGEKIHINFPNASFITNATTSLQTIVEGGTAQIAADAIATSTNYGLTQVILTISGGAIEPSATSTVTVRVGNITNPAKGAYQNLRIFTTTANGGLVDGAFFGMEQRDDYKPPPVDSIQIGGTNTINGVVKVQEADGTLRTVTAAEAEQMRVGMGCPDMMFFAGTKRVNSDGTFTYDHLLDATYIMGVMPNNTSDSSFFVNYLQPNMMQINVTGSETATVTPTFVVPDGVMQGSITGGPANATGIFIRSYTGTMESFSPIFTDTNYATEGLDANGVGYFQVPVKTGYTWNISIMTDTTIASGSAQYWPPVVDPVYIEPGKATTTLSAYSFVEANKTLNVTLRSSTDNSVIDESNPPAPCLNIRRAGTMIMGPPANEVCNTTNVNGVNVYQMKVPAGAFVIEVMMPGAGFREYPVTIPTTATAEDPINETIIIEQPTSYISGSVTDPDNFAVQGVSVMAQGANGSFRQTLTNSSGEYTLYVPPGTYRVEAFAPGYGPLTPKTDVIVTDSANATNQNFTISAGSFKKITGRIYTDVDNSSDYSAGDTTYEDVHIHAYGPYGMNSTMSRSDGTYTLRVPAGSGYTVEAWSNELGHIGTSSGVDASNDTSVNFTVAAQGYLQITITNGNTNNLDEVFAWAFNESTGKGNGSDTWTATSSNADLITKFSLPAGNYRVNVGTPVFGDLTSLAANINATTTTITAGNTSSLTISLPDMATLSGTTTANATVWASRTDGPGKYSTTADSSGAYSMKIPVGYTYMVGASLPGYVNTPVSLTFNGNTTQNLTLTASAYTISGTVSSNGSALTEGFVWAIKAGNNGWTGTELNPDGSYSLDVDSGTWIVYAEAPCYYASNGTSRTGSGTVNISLTAISNCSINVPDVHSIVPTTGGAISQSDITVNIPPNALGTGSSNVSLSVTKPSITPPATLNAAPIATSTKRILVSDSSGSNITSLNNSIEITLTYNESDIPSGATEDDLQLAYWNTTTNTWDAVAATVDTANNTITAKVTHLTDFAPIVPTSANAPDTPTGLTATRNGDTQIDLSWSAVSGATSYLIYRDTSDSGNFPYLATVSSTSYSNTGLSAETTYYYKVSASNAEGESAVSSATSATTCSSVANGTVSGSSCTLTCNSGYTLSGGTCIVSGGVAPISSSVGQISETQQTEETDKTEQTQDIITETKETVTEIVDTAKQIAQEFAQKIVTIATEAAEIVKAKVNDILAKVGLKRSLTSEQAVINKYVRPLLSGMGTITAEAQHAITNFVTYGTPTTLKLGKGERAGVINSYKAAFGKLPTTESEWNDAIKIANGRWPGETSEQAEAKATETFKQIYSEKAGIRIFKAIFGYNPSSATDWDAVRAIAYSGATR